MGYAEWEQLAGLVLAGDERRIENLREAAAPFRVTLPGGAHAWREGDSLVIESDSFASP